MDSPLADAIRGWLGDADPGAEIAPIVMPGFSDSNPFRTAFPDAVVYGFCPHREAELLQAAPLIHGADERVPVVRRRAVVALLLRAAAEGAVVSETNGNRAAPEQEEEAYVLRLGGMALRNGLLIHGPTSWAAAARDQDGEIQVASGPQAGAGTRPGGPRARCCAARCDSPRPFC